MQTSLRIALCLLLLLAISFPVWPEKQAEGMFRTSIPHTKYYEIYFTKQTPYSLKAMQKPVATIAPQEHPAVSTVRQQDWFQIRYGNRNVWVRHNPETLYIRPIPEKKGPEQTLPQRFYYLHHPVNVYQDADPTKFLMRIQPQRIDVLSVSGGWYSIRTEKGVGWFFDDGHYVTPTLGIKTIVTRKAVPLYRHPNDNAPSVGVWFSLLPTTAYASTGQWYKIEKDGHLYWVKGTAREVKIVATSFAPKYSSATSYIGNAIFMTQAEKTRMDKLKRRMVTTIRGKQERLFDTFIVRPVHHLWQNNGTFQHPMEPEDEKRDSLVLQLDRLFADNQQLDLLETASAELGTTTNVILGVPHPYGSVPDRQRADLVKWYIDELVKRWEAKRPSHLTLKGFYWTAESAPVKDRELIQETAIAIHKLGYRFYWAPYYGAENAEKWRLLGFDFAWHQPNHYFAKMRESRRGEDMLRESYLLARETGGGTMLEWDWRIRNKADLENAQKLVGYLRDYILVGREMGAEKGSILVYDSEGEIDNAFPVYQDPFDELRPVLFDYLLGPMDSVSRDVE